MTWACIVAEAVGSSTWGSALGTGDMSVFLLEPDTRTAEQQEERCCCWQGWSCEGAPEVGASWTLCWSVLP